METLRLCLARHGETDWNVEGRVQGQLDIPLNRHGLRQADALGRALADVRFDAVVSSDLLRAQRTALPLAEAIGQQVMQLAGWRERHHGRMQGQTYEELASTWPEGHRRLRARDPGFDVDGGESLITLAERCARGLAALRAGHAAGSVLLVTHGGVLDAVHRLIIGQPLHEPRKVSIRNCAYHWLRHDGHAWCVEVWGCEAHLDGARDELPV